MISLITNFVKSQFLRQKKKDETLVLYETGLESHTIEHNKIVPNEQWVVILI